MELVTIFGFASARDKCERLHFGRWGKPTTWWAHRAQVLGYSVADLKKQVQATGKRYRNQQQALLILDRPELIRVAIIDLLMGLGNSAEYARNVGDVAKMMACQLPLVFDNDHPGELDFKTPEQKRLIASLDNPALPGGF